MTVKATPNPPGTAELVERLQTLRGVLYADRPKMGPTETVMAAVAELGGTQEALTRLLTLCAGPDHPDSDSSWYATQHANLAMTQPTWTRAGVAMRHEPRARDCCCLVRSRWLLKKLASHVTQLAATCLS